MSENADNTVNNIEKLDRKECCGCSSCMQKCPKNAITMIENEEGFFFPHIDKEKCINCGLCIKACPQFSKINSELENYPKVFSLYNKNKNIQRNSSSGGVFFELADYVLRQNGVVFGAAYNTSFKVIHIMVENKDDLKKLNKSKYLQSDVNFSYRKVEELLKKDRLVLYSGTPCQIMGLKKYLIKDYDKLLTCDIICHGVPSYKAFNRYLQYLYRKFKS